MKCCNLENLISQDYKAFHISIKHHNRRWYQLSILCVLVFSSAWVNNSIASADTKDNAFVEEEILVIRSKIGAKRHEATELTEKLILTAGTFGDPMQAIFTLPGIVQIAEDDPEPAVQGSSPSANLFLIDDVPVKFLFHPFGQSIFNENLIHDFGLNSAGFGSRYGQATGAVFDVTLRDPKNQPLETTIDLSFLRAGILFESGLTTNQSFYFSYREGLLPFYIEENERDEEDIEFSEAPAASDYQGKYFWDFGDKGSLTFLVAGAEDGTEANIGKSSEEVLLDPGLEGDVALNAKFDSQSLKLLYGNTKLVLGHSEDKQFFRIGNGEFLNLAEDAAFFKTEHHWSLNNHLINVGTQVEESKFNYSFDLRLDRCSDFSSDECGFGLGESIEDTRKQKLTFYDVFIEDFWSLNKSIDLILGVHGSSDDYLKDTYLDPRIKLNWKIFDQWALSASIGRYHQTPGIDEIFPIIGNPDLDYTEATHYVIGLNHSYSESLQINANLYYKNIGKLVVGLEEGDIPYSNTGDGKAYGAEFMISKDLTNRWHGWLTVSLSKTERTNTLTGEKIAFSYDVPVVINGILNYQLTQKWNIGGRWTYRSGTLYTPITDNKENPDYPGFYVPIYGQLNSERVGDFHRLDIRVERSIFNEKGIFFIDFINAYGRQNTSGIEYIGDPDSSEFRLQNIEGYGVIPSIGIKLTF